MLQANRREISAKERMKTKGSRRDWERSAEEKKADSEGRRIRRLTEISKERANEMRGDR